MGDFLIGIGTHAGSVWFAWAFTSEQHGIKIENERLSGWFTGNWVDKVQGMLTGDMRPFANYFDKVREQFDCYNVYCDFNSWAPFSIPAVAQQVPVSRVIVIMRNGIQQLYSLTSASYMWTRVTDDHWLVATYLRHLWEVGGAKGKPWEQRTLWEKKCEMWASTIGLIDWMKKQGLPVEIYRLEDLTTDVELFRRLMRSFSPIRQLSYYTIQKIQQMDIHRKVHIDRTPSNLWQQWTVEQQTAFNEFCDEGMRRYGYETLAVGM